jgi:periplasmic protein TonB
VKPAAFISILAHAGVVAWMFSSFAEPPSPAPGGAAGFSVSFGGPGAAAPMEAAPAGATPAEAVPVPDAPAVEPVEAVETAEPLETAEPVETVEPVETAEPAEPEEAVEVAEAVPPEPEPVEPEPVEPDVAEVEPVPQEIETVDALEPPPPPPESEPPPEPVIIAEAPTPRAKPTPPPALAKPERREEPRALAQAAPARPAPVAPSAPAAVPSNALADRPAAGSGPSETVAAASAGTGSTAAEGPADGRTEDQKAAYFARLSAWLERHKKYPDRARMRRQEGRVMLRFVVDRGGRVLDHRIVRSSGHPVLDHEVEAMIARAQPLPAMPSAMPDGQVELVVPVDFALR